MAKNTEISKDQYLTIYKDIARLNRSIASIKQEIRILQENQSTINGRIEIVKWFIHNSSEWPELQKKYKKYWGE